MHRHEEIINAQIDEIKRLKKRLTDIQNLAIELLPYLQEFVTNGLGLGESPAGHENCEECADCMWHKKATEWKARFDSGEIDSLLK